MLRCKKIWLAGRAFVLASIILFTTLPARAVIRDGGVDPSNLGKGGWLYRMPDATNQLAGNIASVTNENSLFSYLKSQGLNFVIVKAGTDGELWNGGSHGYETPQFTSNLVQSAHDNGLLIFGSNRSSGQDIPGEIAVADYVFQEGADGFIWDAEAEWESTRPWITNGPVQAWALCSAVRARHPTKFLAHNPIDIISVHTSFPYKEFGYWSDCVMPQVYHHQASLGSASAAVNWADVNWRAFHTTLSHLAPSVIDGQTIYWTNAIKPLLYMREAYGANQTEAPPNPPNDLTEFMDYMVADPNCPTAGGFKGSDHFRCELYDTNQWANLKASTIGDFPNVVNNLVLDDNQAELVGSWTLVPTIACTAGAPGFYGETGTDRNAFGTNYWKIGQGTGAAYAQFTPRVVVPGDYDIYQWHPLRAEASASVPVVITHVGGTTTVQANQQTNDGTWSWLGRFPFAAGTSGNIRVTDNVPEPNTLALVDGLKLVFVPPLSLPAAPINLTATGMTTWQIDLAWQDTSTNETGFIVAQGTSPGGPYSQVALLGANATHYSVVGLAAGTPYYYIVYGTNYLGVSDPSAEAAAATLPGVNYPPAIDTPPSSQTVDAGSNVTFAVTVTGTPPMSYQWRHDNADISGATSSALSLSNAQPADAGNYAVVITNAYGGTTSAPVALTVLTHPPGILAQPESQTVLAGGRVGFNVLANGTAPLFYQWQCNGTNLPGATGSGYTNLNVQLADSGSYTVVVTNAYGRVTSSNALLVVLVPPAITLQPQSQWVTAGDSVTFNVLASGTAPLSYQWQRDGTNISAATDSSFSKSGVVLSDAAQYSVVVGNIAGSLVSSNATLTVTTEPVAPAILAQPQDWATVAGQSGTLSVRASGTTPLFYQWRLNDTALSGATQMDLNLRDVAMEQSGVYSVMVSNAVGSVLSSNATVTVNARFQIGGMTQLWALRGGSRSYLTTASQYERGMAYNPKSNRVLVVTRSGSARIFVLDGDTGADLHSLNISTVSEGYYLLMMIGVADDGVVYATDLTLSGAGRPFKLYRWANDNANTVPTVAYTGNPSPLNDQRWGDSLAVRGAGTNTQVLVGSLNGTNFVMLTTTNGLKFTAQSIDVPEVPAGSFGLGLAFGQGDTFWSRANGAPLQQVSFDLNAGTAACLRSYTNFFPAVRPVGIHVGMNLLAGVAIETPDNMKLFDLSSPTAEPRLIATNAFASDNANGYVTGAVAFGRDRVYALDSNNGLLALRLDATTNSIPMIVDQPSSSTIVVDQAMTMSALAIGTPPMSYQWQFNGLDIPNANTTVYSLGNAHEANAGTYSLVVSNAFGVATSLPATLTVLTPPPTLSSQPQNTTVAMGAPVTLTSTATGPGPLNYQWRLNGMDLDGATTNTFSLLSAQASDAGSYSVLVSNPYGATLSSNATLTVKIPATSLADDFDPEIDSSQWQSFGGTVLATNFGGCISAPNSLYFSGAVRSAQTWPLNTTAGGLVRFQLRVASSNSSQWHAGYAGDLPYEPITFEFSTNFGATWVEAGWYDTDLYRDWTQVAFFIPPDAQTVHTSFRWAQKNVYDSARIQWALDDVAITPGLAAPVITRQPQNQPALAGGVAEFSVTIVGTPPLSYQWLCNGTNLANETNAALVLSGIATNQAGSYSVEVANALGSALSANATLRVFEPANSFAEKFDSGINLAQWWSLGGRVLATNYGGSVSGTSALWFGGFGSRYAISRPLNTSSGGLISFQLRTGSGQTDLWNWLEFASNAIVVEASTDAGSNWTQLATYEPNFYFNWTALTVPIEPSGQSPATLVRWRQLFNYGGEVYDQWALDDVGVQMVTNAMPPTVVVQPTGATLDSGMHTNLSAVINGSAPLVYQWWFSNQVSGSLALPGATNWALVLTDLQTSQSGSYWLLATNALGWTSSLPAILTITEAVPLDQALDATNLVWETYGFGLWRGQTNVTHDGIDAVEVGRLPGSQYTFLYTTVTGPGTVSFWWKVSSATNASYLFAFIGGNQPIISGEVGWTKCSYSIPPGLQNLIWYYYKVNNAVAGQDKGWIDQVSFVPTPPPAITAQPQSQTVALGSTAQFRVTATSSVAMTYQWQFQGADLAGATSSTLTLSNLQFTNAGNYSVSVSNLVGAVMSSNAVLTVVSPLRFSSESGGLNLSWSGSCALQSATNVAGPYADETNAASPCLITPGEGQRFFRLRMVDGTMP